MAIIQTTIDRWQDRCATTLLPKHHFGNVKLDGWWGDEGSPGRSDLDEWLKQLAIFEFRTTICDTWKVNKICITPHYFICLNKHICRVWTNRSDFTHDFARFSTGKRSSSFVKIQYEYHYRREILVGPWLHQPYSLRRPWRVNASSG